VGFGEPGERQDLASGGVEVFSGVDEPRIEEVVDDTAMLCPHLFR